MRTLIVFLLALALAAPAATALASRGGDDRSGSALESRGGASGKQAKRRSHLQRTGLVTVASRVRGDDEVEVTGRVTALVPLTVGGVACVVPAGVSLGAIAVGDRVEMTCDLVRGVWLVRKAHLEDECDDDHGDRAGHRHGGGHDDDDDDSRRGSDDD